MALDEVETEAGACDAFSTRHGRPGAGVPQDIDVYARVSRLGDDRQRSTDGQVNDCVARIVDRGARVGTVHIDSGRSAWNPRVHRDGWDTLMRRLESGRAGGVCVFDLARFSRRPIEGERLIVAAERGLLVLDSEDEYDLTTANGKKAFRDHLASAAHESDRLSTRVRRGKRLKAIRGEPNSNRRAFGFEADRVTVWENEAAELRRAARRILDEDMSQDAISKDFNARGIRTSTGGEWTPVTLRQVLLRPSNAGLITYQGAVVSRMPGEPIFDPDTWARLSATFAARRRGRPSSETYLCSGLVRCGLCGTALTGRPRPHLRRYPDGSVRRQYWCHPRGGTAGCGRVSVDQRELDRHVGALVMRILADPRHAATVEAISKAAGEQRRALEAEIAECEHLLEELAGRLGRREMSLARHDAAAQPLDHRLVELHATLAELGSPAEVDVSPEMAAASLAEWRDRWTLAGTVEQRALIRRALRGRRLVVQPADPNAPRQFDPRRVIVD